MSTTGKLGYEFLQIPKLEVSGTNWVIYKDWFTWSLDACGILDHIDRSGKEPKDPIAALVRIQEEFSAEQKLLDLEWRK